MNVREFVAMNVDERGQAILDQHKELIKLQLELTNIQTQIRISERIGKWMQETNEHLA